MLTRDQAKTITDKVLSLSKADQAVVTLRDETTSHLRFARNTPSTSGTSSDVSLTVASSFGNRTGAATANQLDDASLAAVVRRAEELARLAPEDPEFVPALGAQAYAEVAAHDEETASRGPERLADGVARCLTDAVAKDLVAAGYTQSQALCEAMATSGGLFGYHRSTGAYLSETARTRDATGSGWAAAADHRIGHIDYGAVSRTAVAKALASAAPRDLAPGSYVTILEPACVANLLGMMMFSMDARRADEGRSYFSASDGGNRRGEKLFPESVHVYSDPADALAPGRPWGDDGVAQQRRAWIEGGTLANLAVDRYWAQKTGAEAIPRPTNLIMRGGAGTVDDLIASTERGVLVTSLWYIRSVDPRTMLLTGLTRDGVFWIEDGKISHPVHNFRWNDSPISVLKNVEAMSAAVRMPPRPWHASSFMMPALKVKSFQLSSVSEAV